MSYHSLAATIADGTTASYAIPFPYLDPADVHWYLDGVEITDGITYNTVSLVTLVPTPAAGAVVLRRRITSLENNPITFTGASISSTSLNTLQTVLRYGIQEAVDYATYFGGTGGGGGGGSGGDMFYSENLAFLASKPAARANLGLGTAAIRDVGTATGTVAAGDDPRFSAQLGAAGLADVNDYLLPGDTNYQDAFIRCLAACNHVYVPAKPRLAGATDYRVTTITLGDQQTLQGDGSDVTDIVGTSASAPVIYIGSSNYNTGVRGVTCRHASTPSTGGDGIAMGQGLTDWVNNGYFEDVTCSGNYVGWNLGKAYRCVLQSCSANANLSDGFRFTTTGNATVPGPVSTGGPVQWVLVNCAAGSNGRDGYHYEVSGAAFGAAGAGSSMGTLTGCVTYANTRHGVSAVGTAAHPLNSFRWDGGFIGEDGGHGVYLDTYARDHVIAPNFVELSGQDNIHITANNANTCVQVKNCGGAYWDGLWTAGVDTVVTGGIYVNNGRRGSGGSGLTWAGIRVAGGSATITGVQSKNYGSSIQSFGISVTGDDVIVCGCRLTGNASAPIIWATGPTNSLVSGCLPTTANTGGAANTITGDLTVSGSILAGTTITATTDLLSLGEMHIAGDAALAGDVYLSGTGKTLYNNLGGIVGRDVAALRSAAVGTAVSSVAGRLDVAGLIAGASSLSISGSLTGVTSLTASGTITSTGGNITSSNGSVTAPNGTVSGYNLTASNIVTAGVDLRSNGELHVTGASALTGELYLLGTGTRLYINTGGVYASNAQFFGSAIVGAGTPSATTGRFDATTVYRGGTAL